MTGMWSEMWILIFQGRFLYSIVNIGISVWILEFHCGCYDPCVDPVILGSQCRSALILIYQYGAFVNIVNLKIEVFILVFQCGSFGNSINHGNKF